MVSIMLSQSMQAPLPTKIHEYQQLKSSDQARPILSSPFASVQYGPKELSLDGHAQLWQPADTCQRRHVAHPLNGKAGSPSDHLLRRKTPNGTLAAGYDGSLPEHSQGRPTQRHALVPISRFARGLPHQSEATTHHDSAIQAQSNSLISAGRSDRDLDTTAIGHPSLTAIPTAKVASLNPNLMDISSEPRESVLKQFSPQTYSCTTATHYSIPTVLQPLWPPCLGPTALQPPGPVGPYWPDGAFEPYRPAPLQRHRQDGFADQPSKYSTVTAGHSPSLRAEDGRLIESHQVNGVPSAMAAAPMPSRNYDRKPERRTAQPTWSLPRDFQFKLAIDPEQARAVDGPVPNISSTPLVTGSQDIRKSYYTSLSCEQTHFREKTLHWAYKTYCNLLGTFEENRRESAGSHVAETNSAPPQRIRRPYPSWSRKSLQSLSYSSGLPGSGGGSMIKDHHLPYPQPSALSDPRASWGNQPTGSTFRQPPQSVRSGWDNVSHHGASGHTSRQTHSHAKLNRSSHRNSTETSNDSVFAVALKAMEVLSRLCQESHWQWLDGMLLNGCLAYGMGQYSKATKWYLKVLRQDPNNVEAMSNLAATSLALGRKEEAEQYWILSIKQRPAYFEAVEHLVGILHDDGRSQDAVSVIQHVQSSLRDGDKESSQELAMSGVNPSGYAILPCDNGRLLALIHGKGNVLYQSGDNDGAAQAFEDAILIGTGQYRRGICGLVSHVLGVFVARWQSLAALSPKASPIDQLVLLPPEVALETSRMVFPPYGRLPGLASVPRGVAQKAAISIISNALLSLAKIYQDSMSSSGAKSIAPRAGTGVQDILALYYLSLSLQPSPSTANNVGILLAGIQQPARSNQLLVFQSSSEPPPITGVTPGSGVALALAYYDYGLRLDANHAHLYTNLGSLFKDIGHLSSAIRMYERAVECDPKFDIALANLANAVKDRGNIKDAIEYYRRAVSANPDFAEAVCGLANALNSVCNWRGRGGIHRSNGRVDRWHVDEQGLLYDSRPSSTLSSGWMAHVIRIVQKQLFEGQGWGKGVINSDGLGQLITICLGLHLPSKSDTILRAIHLWTAEHWEGAKVVRLVERATKTLTWRLYRNIYHREGLGDIISRIRPQLPGVLAVPSAPTVLPFHTFTSPLTAKQIRLISQRNALRVSCTTLKAPWLSRMIYEPPPPPNPQLNVGYVSSDFNNHPLAHLMQSVFGLHNPLKVAAFCYATTASDGSVHRKQIERESPCFRDCSAWSTERLVNQIVDDDIHILVNLNGYTRGAKNEVFAARPAPIQMSFMGFAGTLGAEWCDYLLADELAIPQNMLRPYRSNVSILDLIQDGNNDDEEGEWVYGENVIYTRETFFCCDHKQSAPDSQERRLPWSEEIQRRQAMRREIFPDLPNDAVILGNFNQLYKIEPTTFRAWLRILSRVPQAVLWLLRFPDLGEQHLRETAEKWVGAEVASRLRFTDVAPKQHHISRASVCDLFLDTPECNAHTTAADVLWSGTPLLTYPKHEYKMCSRMAASILRGALPRTDKGNRAARDLIAKDDESYEDQAVELAHDLVLKSASDPGKARLLEIRQLLFESRWTSALFDTKRWVADLETAYGVAWRRWVEGVGGDIWI